MTVRRVVASSVTAWLVLVLSATGWAQTVNGAIVGVVQDSSGGVVPDVALTLRNIARDEIVATTISGPEGSFSFRNLSPAKYEVQATKDGFTPISLPDVEVTLGSQVRVLVEISAGAISERVEVLGGSSVARHDAHAGAWHLARDAEPVAAAIRHRTARGRDICVAHARCQHRSGQ